MAFLSPSLLQRQLARRARTSGTARIILPLNDEFTRMIANGEL